MCTRSLTDVFILMRNNAVQSRHIYAEQVMSDHVRLLYDESSANLQRGDDIERGELRRRRQDDCYQAGPPAWADALEEAQYVMVRLRTKIAELIEVHRKHVQRPTLDDKSSEEVAAGKLTAEISRHFNTAHRLVQTIKAQYRQGSNMEQRLTANVLSSLVTTLQELSITFRTAQNQYLKTLTSREERSNAYFDVMNFDEIDLNDGSNFLEMTNATMHKSNDFSAASSTTQTSNVNKTSTLYYDDDDQDIDEVFQKPANSRMTQQQLLLLEKDNTEMAHRREEEVNKIVRSIVELNDVFKDLSQMVQDQGTILDRIDYNIEQTQVSVYEGYKQLQKADTYQRKNRKMHCIFVLGSTCVVLLILLLVVKT